MKKILYLTFNDAPGGIFSGQVIDVCLYWRESGFDVKLVSFISIRNFGENKNKIKNSFPGAIVLPMFPKAGNWRLNRFLLGEKIRKINPAVVVCRGVFATVLAMEFRSGRKICFDARGAYEAELNEYNVIPDEKVKAEIASLERKAVLESDFRLAVSNQLVNYWKEKFSYQSDKHVVVPCTLNSESIRSVQDVDIFETRKKIGFNKNDIVIVYSGSNAGWQSLEDLSEKLTPLFRKNQKLKLVLMTKTIPDSFSMLKEFPDRIKQKWTKPEEVIEILHACDYGWLVRENSVTNKVASPVKFAEYLVACLSVIISPELGDYSNFVQEHQCGIIWNEKNEVVDLPEITISEKQRIRMLALNNFRKENFKEQYLTLLA